MTRRVSADVDVWTRACHFVLDQSGRARCHDVRAALNGLALGIEALRHDASSSGPPGGGPMQLLDRMHGDLRTAADELTSLQNLMSGVAAGDDLPIAQMLEWAGAAAAPVARRVGARLTMASAHGVPNVRVGSRLGLAVALALIEGALAAGRDGSCRAEVDTAPPALRIAWEPASTGDAHSHAIAPELLDALLGPSTRLTSDGAGLELRIELTESG